MKKYIVNSLGYTSEVIDEPLTAYELAEKLYLSSMDTYHEEAANMLRQQADRIAELEKQSKPVAWIRSGDDQLSLIKEKDDGYMVWKPLYLAPQTKPLSDEEIKQIWYNLYPLSSSSYWDDKREGLAELKFARAIEERHGIK